jgi:hypothetical protein
MKEHSIFNTEAKHEDLTTQISLLCLKRCLKRLKSQYIYSLEKSLTNSTNYYTKEIKKDFKTIKQAIKIIQNYS